MKFHNLREIFEILYHCIYFCIENHKYYYMKGLSKSKYTAFCQCPKNLWLTVYHPELAKIDESLQARFEEGNIVGDLAMGLFGDFIDVSSINNEGKLDLSAMIEKTKEEIEKGTDNICEASFSFEIDGCRNYCAVDILHKEGDGWAIYEVKSSTFKNNEKDTPDKLRVYSRDIAYQKWLLEKCGVNVTGTYLVRLDSNYIRKGELEIEKLFHIKNMKDLVDEEYFQVAGNVKKAINVLRGDEPEIKIGCQCKDPYLCSFLDYCIGEIPTPNVFDLYKIKFVKACDYFHVGKITFEDLKEEKLDPIQRKQVETFLMNTDFHDSGEIKKYLDQLTLPLYFLDFETMLTVIPLFDGTKPYQQIPFQYSLHWIEKEDGEIHHSEFLGNSIDDPRRALAEQLCHDIPRNVCVTAYNKSFECKRIQEMAEIFPDLSDHLLNIKNHIVDLIDPFRGKMIYFPAMNGSFSIKKVLPALFPDDPELNYANLEGNVHHGGDAMTKYPEIAKMTPKEAEATRKALLNYCKLDTYAMVKIWQKLKELAEN